MAVDDVECQRPRISDALFEFRQLRLLDELQFVLRQRRLAEDLAQELQHGRERFLPRYDRKGHFARRAFHVQRRPQLVELVLDLLVREALGPADHQVGQHLARRHLAVQVLDVAVPQREPHVDLVTPRFLLQQGRLESRGKRFDLGVLVDVLRAEVERLAQSDILPTSVIADRLAPGRRASALSCGRATSWG